MRIVMDHLGHRFSEGAWLFQELTGVLESGEIYALTGPSGSGKSTMLSMLAGWVEPAAGSIRRDSIERISWVFQNPHGVPKRSVLDHVMVPFLAQGEDIQRAEIQAENLLKTFQLVNAMHQPFMSLSGGEAQRLMLARGIAAMPDLFLIDEPTAQLDLATRREVNQVLSALVSDQRIVVVATHDEETRAACTRTLDLKHSHNMWKPRHRES